MTQVLPSRPAPSRRSDRSSAEPELRSPHVGGRYRGGVPARCRPSPERAAACARLAGIDPQTLPPFSEGERRHLRVVDPAVRTAAQRRRRTRALLAAAATVVVGVAFALVYLHVVLAQRQFRVDNIQAQVQQDQLAYQKLRLQVAELNAPQHVISMAEGQLGMVQPANVSYVTPSTVISGTVSQVASSPDSGQAPAGDASWPMIKSELAGSP